MKESRTKLKSGVGLLILVVGCLFILIGSLRGEIDTVWAKAVAICLECVGIG